MGQREGMGKTDRLSPPAEGREGGLPRVPSRPRPGRTARRLPGRPLCLLPLLLLFFVLARPASALPERPARALGAPVRLVVLAPRGEEEAARRWRPTADHLARALGRPVRLIPLGRGEIEPTVLRGGADYLIVDPALYVELESRAGASRILTLESRFAGRDFPVYGGAVFVRADRGDLRTLADLRGKRLVTTGADAFGDWTVVRRELRAVGADPPGDLAALTFSGGRAEVVRAVLSGRADAGAVRTGALERMAAAGEIRLSDVRVLPPPPGVSPDRSFPLLRSTRIYPEWAMAECRSADPGLSKRIVSALLALSPEHPAVRASGWGWTICMNYTPVRECLRELGLPPYDRPGEVSPRAVLRQYGPWILGILLLLAVLAASLTALVLFHRRRMAAVRSLARSEEELRAITETSPDDICLTDPEGRIRFSSPSGLEMFRVASPEEIQGRSVFDFLHPEDRERAVEAARRVLAGEIVPPREYRAFRCDGSPLWVEANGRRLEDGRGGARGMVLVVRDTTARKEMEMGLREAKERAEAADRAKGAFLANVSHEIRTPLNGVLGMLELLEGDLEGELRERVRIASRSGEQLLRLIDDLLDLAKIESGRLEPESVDFDLRGVLGEIEELFREQARSKGLLFRVEADPEVPRTLRGDPVRIRQVLTNLAGNALKFTEKGEVSIRATLVPPAPAGESPPGGKDPGAGGGIRFSVTDTGIGIAPETVPRLFSPFAQADGSMARRYGGTGLGLWLSRRLADLMGGTLGMESRLGRGSTFYLELPLRAGEPETVLPREEAEGGGGEEAGPPPRGGRILIVEDHPVNRRVVRALLEKMGQVVTEAAEGFEALRAVARDPFDLILMDLQMPGMDGLEAIRRLKAGEAGEAGRRIPVVALTARAMREDRERCLEAGMEDYLTKPIRRLGLERVLRRFLGKGPSEGAGTRGAGGPSVPGGRGEETALNGDGGGGGGSGGGPPVFDREGLLDRSLEDVVLARELVDLFLREAPSSLKELARAAREGDREEGGRVAHALKGAAANVGAEVLRGSLEAVERAFRGGGPVPVDPERLARELRAFREAAEAGLGRPEA